MYAKVPCNAPQADIEGKNEGGGGMSGMREER